MAYVTEQEIRAYGIADPRGIDLAEQASRIIDLHVMYPANDDGWKFPRKLDYYRGIPDDKGEIIPAVKFAVLEQILYMLQSGMQYVREGADDGIVTNRGGFSKTKAKVDSPLLAPLAKLHLRRLMTRVGYIND
jgi:hypothetical protein